MTPQDIPAEVLLIGGAFLAILTVFLIFLANVTNRGRR